MPQMTSAWLFTSLTMFFGLKTPKYLRWISLCAMLMLLPPSAAKAVSDPLTLLEGFGFRELALAESLNPRVLLVRQEDKDEPVWKRSWDEARMLAVRGDLSRAADRYRALLEEKEISEAQWELVTILLALGRGGEAIDDIESLCEDAPDHPGYLHALALSNLALGRFKASAQAFHRLFQVLPDNNGALAGWIYSLLAGEEGQEAVAPLSTLVQRVSQRPDLKEALAILAYENNDYATAWRYLLELTKSSKPSPALLQMAAKVSEARQSPAQAEPFWVRYVAIRPDDLEARQWLARYYAQIGDSRQALPHLEVIHQHHTNDLPVLKRLGLGYLEIHDYGRSATALSEYLALHPDDTEAARSLVAARYPLGNTADTLQALEHFFALESSPDQESLALAARLYASIDDNHQAAAVYRRLLTARPGDPEILTQLAQHLEAAGRHEEALTVWRQLAQLSPSSLDPWRHLAAILERLDRKQELYESLAKLHQLDPADTSRNLRLLEYYATAGDVDRGMVLIADMERLGDPLPEVFYYWRGDLRWQRGDYAAALPDLERFLGQDPGSEQARQMAITAAGRLGDTARVRRHHHALTGSENGLSSSLLLFVAQAYADCRAESEARALLEKVADGQGVEVLLADRKKAYADLAESFARENLLYEAEESLRIGLAVSGDRGFFLPRLVNLALSQGQVAAAKEWLAGLRHPMDIGSRRFTLLEAAVVVGQGELRKARNLLNAIEADWATNTNKASGESSGTAEDVRDRLQVASLWLKTDRPQKAELHCLKALALDQKNLEALALLEKIRHENKRDTEKIDLAGLRFEQLCDLAEVYRRHEMTEGMANAARQALSRKPGSLKAGLLRAEALIAQGKVDEALAQMKLTSAANPEDFSLKVRVAAMEFLRGETALVEELAGGAYQGWRSRPDLLLLQARCLWRETRWEEALQVYHDYLTPPVADKLRASSQKYGVALPDETRMRTVWEVVTRDPGPDRDLEFADQVMTPTRMISFLDRGAGDFALEASRLVAAYRWQAQFAMEYAPRKSALRQEYTIAKKQYEAFLARYPHETLILFDLAGMHSVLGDLGEEAAAYSVLDAEGIEFAELNEAVLRNQLKQKPRATVIFGYQNESGRNGYVDRDKGWQGLSFWNSFTPLHDGEVSVERINYHAGSSSDVVRATRAVGSYSARLLSGVTVRGGVGVHGHDGGDRQELVANATAVGKVGDGLKGALSYDRDVVDDTTTSLRRHIFQQDMLGGITLEPLPRLAVGGGYLARDYSDNNWTAGYDLWFSYLLVSEPTFLQLKYSYDFKESKEGGQSEGPLEPDGFAANDHPYWAPKNYWQNQVGLFFKHSLAKESLGREAPRYYALEYLIGHDVDGYATQTAKASLFAECTNTLLVEAAAELSDSQSFRRQEYRASISYRW